MPPARGRYKLTMVMMMQISDSYFDDTELIKEGLKYDYFLHSFKKYLK